MSKIITNIMFVSMMFLFNGCLTTRQFFVGEENHSVTKFHIETALSQNRLPEYQNISSVRLHRGETSSYHLIQIREGEPMHLHREHDLTVVVYHGRGIMHVGTNRFPVATGDILYIPKETPHSYQNEMLRPSVAVAIFTPPLDGEDMTLIKNSK